MKKNSKGFMITEALIVSTIVLAVLIFMYAQFRSINNGFNQTFKYNTVENIYRTNEIKKFIESDAINNMIYSLNESEKGYLDITECNVSTYNDVSFCNFLYDKLKVKSILLLSEDVTTVVNSGMQELDLGTQNFLKYIKNNYTGDYYRIVVIYEDGTYATLRINILRTVYDFGYTDDVQIFTAPISGYYQIELWGAEGSTSNGIDGYGAYAKGTVSLEKDDILYIYIGEEGNNTGDVNGTTYISFEQGLISSSQINKDSIIIVAASGNSLSYINDSKLEKIGKIIYCYECSSNEDTYTISTTDASENPTSSFAKIGNGYARITMISG